MVLAVSLLCGCATLLCGGHDKRQISNVLDDWAAAMIAKEVDPLMGLYSEDFSHYEWGDKEGFKEFISEAIDDAYLNDAEVDLEEAEITIEEKTATAYPVQLSAAFGSATIEFSLAKEDGTWRIVGMDVSE